MSYCTGSHITDLAMTVYCIIRKWVYEINTINHGCQNTEMMSVLNVLEIFCDSLSEVEIKIHFTHDGVVKCLTKLFCDNVDNSICQLTDKVKDVLMYLESCGIGNCKLTITSAIMI